MEFKKKSQEKKINDDDRHVKLIKIAELKVIIHEPSTETQFGPHITDNHFFFFFFTKVAINFCFDNLKLLIQCISN